jgi:23S rRNA pseudouridine2605 synthase
VTIALNKPLGVVSTMDDPKGRPTVADLIRNREERLFHVGRLDADSEGLLLLTNDGELANRLSHPKYQIAKTYLVTVEGEVYPRTGRELLKGVELDDGIAKMDAVHVLQQIDGFAMLEVVLHEGRNRIVRRMFDAVGHPVTRLVRTRIGPIPLGDLKPGRTRVLGRTELGTLMGAVDL